MSENKYPKRKNIGLKGYDYSQNGCYYMTVCVKDKRHLLAHYRSRADIIRAGFRARPQDAIVLTPLGKEVEKSIGYINTHYKYIDVENSTVMSNHIHSTITIDNIEARYTGGHEDPPLHDVIARLKSYTTKNNRW